MYPALRIIALLILPTYSQNPNFVPPYAYLAYSTDGGASETSRTLAQAPGFGEPLPSQPNPAWLPVTLAEEGSLTNFGCTAPLSPPTRSGGAILVSRGNCSFAQKVQVAQVAGAQLVVVYDSLANKYWGAGGATWDSPTPSVGKCDLDCAVFTTTVAGSPTLAEALGGFPGQCASKCPSKLCGLAPLPPGSTTPPTSRTLCCIPNDYLVMGGGAAGGVVDKVHAPPPAIWLTTGDGEVLRGSLLLEGPSITPKLVRAGLRPLPSWEASGLVLWCIGCGVAALASWFAAGKERKVYLDALAWRLGVGGRRRGEVGRNGRPYAASSSLTDLLPQAPPIENLTVMHAATLLCTASLFLGGLYVLLLMGVPIVYLVMAAFSLGATSSSAYVLVIPAVSWLYPKALEKRVAVPGFLHPLFRYCGEDGTEGDEERREGVVAAEVTVPAAPGTAAASAANPSDAIAAPIIPNPPFDYTLPLSHVISFPLAAAFVLTWFLLRHSPGAFVGQNIFGACLCCLAVATMKLPTLRSAALLLWALFFYDIFMVFITPYLIGESIMVEVATAGAPSPVPATSLATPACYCRLNPWDWAVCGPGEMMPILFAIPRMGGDFRGGMSMLGLGDIVVPALALSVLLRFDYEGGRGGGGGEAPPISLPVEMEDREREGGGVLGQGGEMADGEGEEGQEESKGLLPPSLSATLAMESPARRRSGQHVSFSTATPSNSFRGTTTSNSTFVTTTTASLPSLPILTTLLPPKPKAGWLSYWFMGWLGYCLGLTLAQVAVTIMRLGQPALLYLVPCVLLPVMATAHWRGEFDALWRGRVVGGGARTESFLEGGERGGAAGTANLPPPASIN